MTVLCSVVIRFILITCIFYLIRKMEVVDETPKASPEEDVISSMPDIVINKILDRLPIQEAVRTCILSKDWRYKWKILSQLVFDKEFNGFLQATKNERDDY